MTSLGELGLTLFMADALFGSHERQYREEEIVRTRSADPVLKEWKHFDIGARQQPFSIPRVIEPTENPQYREKVDFSWAFNGAFRSWGGLKEEPVPESRICLSYLTKPATPKPMFAELGEEKCVMHFSQLWALLERYPNNVSQQAFALFHRPNIAFIRDKHRDIRVVCLVFTSRYKWKFDVLESFDSEWFLQDTHVLYPAHR